MDPVPLPPPVSGRSIDDLLGLAAAARAGTVVATRAQAMQNSVVNRSRDVVCGVLSALPITRKRTYAGRPVEDLGPGWLSRPDPGHTGAWFVSWVTDDLFFYGYAYARVTSRDTDGQPNALQWMPFLQVLPTPAPYVVPYTWPDGRMVAQPGQAVTWAPPGFREVIAVAAADLVIFESPLSGALVGTDVLSTSSKLDGAAARFAAMQIPAGVLQQIDGEDLSPAELQQRATDFAAAREVSAIAAVNRYMKYEPMPADAAGMQLVEGRSYQDVATARVCNVPAFIVNTAVPGDSMTYKTALTARLDLLDFGLEPYVQCWEQTLSAENVTPRGTAVVLDLEPFLRTSTLSNLIGPGVAAPADVKTA